MSPIRIEENLSPDLLLGHVRRGVTEWEQAPPDSREEREAAERVTAAIATLDDWLSHGGQLPTAWSGELALLVAAAGELWDSTGGADPHDVLSERQRAALDHAADLYRRGLEEDE